MRIDPHGRCRAEQFSTRNLWDGNFRCYWPPLSAGNSDTGYINDLKSIAPTYGFDPCDVDVFLGYGLCPEEIEEIMCCGEV